MSLVRTRRVIDTAGAEAIVAAAAQVANAQGARVHVCVVEDPAPAATNRSLAGR